MKEFKHYFKKPKTVHKICKNLIGVNSVFVRCCCFLYSCGEWGDTVTIWIGCNSPEKRENQLLEYSGCSCKMKLMGVNLGFAFASSSSSF